MTRARATALVLGGGAAGMLRLPAAAQTAETIRVAAIPITGAAEAAMAQDMGFFAKVGVDVDLQAMQGSAAIASAVLGGSADIGFSAVDTLVTAHEKGLSLVIVAPATEYVSTLPANDAVIVVPANSQVRQAKDLNGKTFAVNSLTGIANLTTRMWIDQNGGDSASVKFVEVPFSTMPAAIESGRVDAVQVAEPFITATEKNGRVLADNVNAAVAKQFLVTAWFTTAEWAGAHAAAVRAFAAAIRETAIWANQASSAAKRNEILARYTKINPAAIATMTPPHYGVQLTPATVQPLVDVTAKYGKFSGFPARTLLY